MQTCVVSNFTISFKFVKIIILPRVVWLVRLYIKILLCRRSFITSKTPITKQKKGTRPDPTGWRIWYYTYKTLERLQCNNNYNSDNTVKKSRPKLSRSGWINIGGGGWGKDGSRATPRRACVILAARRTAEPKDRSRVPYDIYRVRPIDLHSVSCIAIYSIFYLYQNIITYIYNFYNI